jgi:hypothetical protein
MSHVWVSHLVSLLCLLGSVFPLHGTSASPAPQKVCADALAEFQANPGWLTELRDPVLTNTGEIRERINRYGVLFRCMSSGGIPVVGEIVEVNRLVTQFMLFAGGSLFPEAQSEALNYTLTLNDIQDPAVKILRDELGIPAPPGYIYIWLYPSHASLPKALREYASDTSVRGLTLQSRYIVVFDNVRPGTPLEEYERDQRSAVLSHEFVHVYIKSYLGPKRGFSLPTWYDEGLAIYLSGSSEPTSASYFDENGRQVTWSIPPKDYARYRDDFHYLEEQLGRERLLGLIRRSILENSPDILLHEAGQQNEAGLFQLAEASRIRRGITRLTIGVGILAAVVVLFFVFRRVVRQRSDRGWSFKAQPALAPAHQSKNSQVPESELVRLTHQVQLREDLDPDAAIRTRYYAALSLAYHDEPQAADALMGALTDDCAVVRAGAARGLGEWSARLAKTSRLNAVTRGQILNGLFPLLDHDPANEARWAAAEAIFRVSGEGSLRPIRSAVRRWSQDSGSPDALLNQGWYVQWLVSAGMPHLLVDAYSWALPDVRQAIITHLRGLPADEQEKCLALARSASDPRIRDLPEIVQQAE